MANKNLNSPVVDRETGSIDFPYIRVDSKDIFMHNYSAFMNKINKNDNDRPKKWLFAANSEKEDIPLTKTSIYDKNYSHTELRSAVNDINYSHPDAQVRKDYTFGDITTSFMTDETSSEDKGFFLDNNQIAFSFDLGKPVEFYPDEYLLLARRKNKYYELGDIVYTTSRSIPSYMRLKCVKAGKTEDNPFVLKRT